MLKLESFRISGKLYTSKPAIVRFIQAQQVPTELATVEGTPQAGQKSTGRPAPNKAAKQATVKMDAEFGQRKEVA